MYNVHTPPRCRRLEQEWQGHRVCPTTCLGFAATWGSSIFAVHAKSFFHKGFLTETTAKSSPLFHEQAVAEPPNIHKIATDYCMREPLGGQAGGTKGYDAKTPSPESPRSPASVLKPLKNLM